MHLARVTGTIWATRKYEDMDGATLQLLQPLDDDLSPLGRPLIAADTVGAGPGELVLYITAYEAVIPFVTRRGGKGLGTLTPLDASIVAIVERWDRDGTYTTKAAPEKGAPSPAHPERSGAAGAAKSKGGGAKEGKP